MRDLVDDELSAVTGGEAPLPPPAISFPSKEIKAVAHKPDGTTVYFFTDGSQFSVPPPYYIPNQMSGSGPAD